MPNKLTLWSVNGGRFVAKTPDEEPQTLKWLQSLEDPDTPIPDVLLISDFRVSLLKHLSRLPHFHFMPMTIHRIWGKPELVGVVLASQHPIDDVRVYYTWGAGTKIEHLQGVGDDNQRIKPDYVADALVLQTEKRGLIAATIKRDAERTRVVTGHGFWTRGGVPTPEQMQSTHATGTFLADESLRHNGLIFMADCNLDREGKVLALLKLYGAQDWLSSEVKTTLADHHPGAKFGAKPDRIFTFPGSDGDDTAYEVDNVRLDASPGSDHLMLCADIERVYTGYSPVGKLIRTS